ncbi:MAG: exopolyphosphatase [Planctomycetota bacterium]
MNVLTRGDLDGLASALLLTYVETIREIRFAHPKDVQDGKVAAGKDDVVVNLPFVPGCGLWFDHHVSQDEQARAAGAFQGRFAVAPSCARVIHDHYAHPDFARHKAFLDEVDRFDSGKLTPADVTDPKDWVLLGYTLDPRTGFGPEFQKYFRWLVEYVKEVSLEKVLQHPEVKKRCERVRQERDEFLVLLKKHSRADGNVIVTDFRGQRNVIVGNRFLVYTLHPQGNVETRLHDGKGGATVNVAVGKSIFNRTCPVNVGLLCREFGGGGHDGAGTCQLKPGEAPAKIAELIKRLKTVK